ncbi:MAG: hypothetical protein QGH39_01550 [Candidatus Thermoplasmatota archaeon]|jgi:hypothetical protein|nr:hypothetical protein [Candidatus Thermoplasmatota archaeon]MDP7264225.1 hypothetical protein [Candidatus Thermoplasmatota archaeon]
MGGRYTGGIEGMLRDEKDKMISQLRETLVILRSSGSNVMDCILMLEMGYITGPYADFGLE